MKRLVSIILIQFLVTMIGHSQNQIFITVNGQTKTIYLADTEAARQLAEKVKSQPVTVYLNDYGGFEKVGSLPWSLPTENRQITTSAGDIMLYQGNNIVIFYGSNSWSYTPLGKLNGMSAQDIKNFLAGNQVTALLNAGDNAGIQEVKADATTLSVFNMQGALIDMNGRSISDLPQGIYIINGKKQLIK